MAIIHLIGLMIFYLHETPRRQFNFYYYTLLFMVFLCLISFVAFMVGMVCLEI
jgi:hypothetical protein